MSVIVSASMNADVLWANLNHIFTSKNKESVGIYYGCVDRCGNALIFGTKVLPARDFKKEPFLDNEERYKIRAECSKMSLKKRLNVKPIGWYTSYSKKELTPTHEHKKIHKYMQRYFKNDFIMILFDAHFGHEMAVRMSTMKYLKPSMLVKVIPLTVVKVPCLSSSCSASLTALSNINVNERSQVLTEELVGLSNSRPMHSTLFCFCRLNIKVEKITQMLHISAMFHAPIFRLLDDRMETSKFKKVQLQQKKQELEESIVKLRATGLQLLQTLGFGHV